MSEQVSDEENIQIQVIAQNLDQPWEVTLVNDTLYVSERTGSIVSINEGTLVRKPVVFSKQISHQPEAGLLGIAFSNDFERTNRAFAYYSYKENNNFFQRVALIQEYETDWKEIAIILDKIPGGTYHQGGRIQIGPDEKLYVTTGDASIPELAQDLTSLAGKILRLNLDGSIPEDNPFRQSYVYSYGHRNPQGLAWDNNNTLYATEHGSNAYDEINLIEMGKNYGWPNFRGDQASNKTVAPVIHSGEETWAPSGMSYFEGNFYFASLRGESLRKFDPKNNIVTSIISEVGRVRDVLAVEAGIYLITNNTDGRGNPSGTDDLLIFVPKEKL